MIDKKLSALLGSLLLLAAAMPLATAHLTSSTGSATSAASSDGDDCRWEGAFPGTIGCHSDGVSGTYNNDPGNVHAKSSLFPVVVPDQTGGVTGDIILFPLGYFSGASALCDLEVLGDGTSPGSSDETTVDQGPNNGGTVEDGTWDDGGSGGACHTEGQYALASYNTPGCGAPSHAVAEDKVSGGAVWIGSSCDETTTGGHAPSLSQCLINEAISGADPAVLVDCVETFVNGDPVAPIVFCGSDSISDAINYGPGGGSGSIDGVPFPSSGCGGGSAAVFTFSYVNNRVVIPATAGWIDSRDLGTVVPASGPSWKGAATVVVDGFPATADQGLVVCSSISGSGVGGFCIHDSNVAAVYVEDRFLGSDIAFQVCRDSDRNNVCTDAETRFSHDDGSFQNPVAVPGAIGDGPIIVFICAGAHGSGGVHQHHAIQGFGEARSSGGGFSAATGFCGGSVVGKVYVVV